MDEAETGGDGAAGGEGDADGATGADVEDGDGAAGAGVENPPEMPEKLFTPEGDFLLIWGAMAAILTALEYAAAGPATVLLAGGIAGGVSLAGAVANATRRFRPTVGLYTLVMLAAAVAALVAYTTEGVIAAAGFAVVALANGGRVYELGYRGSDSLLDPVREDGDDDDDEGGDGDQEQRDGEGTDDGDGDGSRTG